MQAGPRTATGTFNWKQSWYGVGVEKVLATGTIGVVSVCGGSGAASGTAAGAALPSTTGGISEGGG